MKLVTSLMLFIAGVALLLGTATRSHSTPPVVVPYYGAQFGGGGGLSQADAKRIVELLESIDRRLESIEAKTGGGPLAQKAKGPELLAVAKTHCAACHTPGKADAAGGGFSLFADEKGAALLPLSGQQKTRVKQAVADGTMPPSGRRKLSAEEKAAFKW